MKTTPQFKTSPGTSRSFAFWWQLVVIALFGVFAFGGFSSAFGHDDDDDDDDDDDRNPAATNVVYLTTNNAAPGQNAVLAYRRHPATGALTQLGSFPTRGTGFYNDDERLGPDDSDQELIASPDRRFLFAVNSGSNSIAAFRIKSNGTLKHVKGSPFSSGGVQPVSLGLAGSKLYVVNKGDLEPGETDGALPNYTGFHVNSKGKLNPINGSTFEVIPGSHPTQALVSPGGGLLFGADLFAFAFPPPPGFPPFVPAYASALRSFRILSSGRLVQSPGSPQTHPLPPPNPPFMLGLQTHPTRRLLYVGFVIGGQLATFEYNTSGQLTFLNAAASTGLGICWIEVNRGGTFAYSSNSTDDSISVFSLADPRAPVEIQKVDLNGPKEVLGTPAAVIFTTTPFQLELDPSGRFLYVLNHETTPDDRFPEGNQVHILKVGADGKVTETAGSPLILPVPAGAHPKGIIVL